MRLKCIKIKNFNKNLFMFVKKYKMLLWTATMRAVMSVVARYQKLKSPNQSFAVSSIHFLPGVSPILSNLATMRTRHRWSENWDVTVAVTTKSSWWPVATAGSARDVTHSITRVWPYVPFIRDTSWPAFKLVWPMTCRYCTKSTNSGDAREKVRSTENDQSNANMHYIYSFFSFDLKRRCALIKKDTKVGARAIWKLKEPSALLSIALMNDTQRSTC